MVRKGTKKKVKAKGKANQRKIGIDLNSPTKHGLGNRARRRRSRQTPPASPSVVRPGMRSFAAEDIGAAARIAANSHDFSETLRDASDLASASDFSQSSNITDDDDDNGMNHQPGSQYVQEAYGLTQRRRRDSQTQQNIDSVVSVTMRGMMVCQYVMPLI